MSNSINLKKGLDIPISGAPKAQVSFKCALDVVAVCPSDFKDLTPRLLVKEGDAVKAGSPVMADKVHPEILLTSPVSGTVKEIVRGEKRKLLAVLVESSQKQEYVDFGSTRPENLSAEQIRKTLLESGLWAAIIQRPYGVIADPALKPKAIFISSFSTAPLAGDTAFTLAPEFEFIQAGVTALSKITDGGVHVSIKDDEFSGSAFHRLENAILHSVKGKHPAGNVGVQISHISPILKGETVWTVPVFLVSAIGKLFLKGKYDLTRKVAVGGPEANDPAYAEALPGTPMKAFSAFWGSTEGLRIVSGDVLTGKAVGENGYLGFFDDQVTVLKEGTEPELFGWAKPFRFNQFSSTRSYFSRLCGKKRYNMDTNLHGGPRAFVMSDSYYSAVLPMDIYPLYLVKACLAGDIDKMEQFGIYEVLPEDLALCEFTDPSKNDIQDIVRSGIDIMIKEMA